MKHLRLDFGVASGPRVTPQGFLRLDASLGRVGVLRYTQPDGSVKRELRLPEEVFAPTSLETLQGAPLTLLHPPVTDAWLNRQTWRDYQIGFVGDNVRQDGALIAGTVTVQDEKAVQGVLAGKLRELSPGYRCTAMEETPGVHPVYGAYDAIQRGIIHNHAGIGPREWGRQGKDVAIKLDGGADEHVGILRLDASALGDFLRTKISISGLSTLEVARKTGILEPLKGNPLLFSGSSTETWVLDNILDGWTPRPTDQQLEALARVLDVPMDDLIRLLPEAERRFDGLTHSPARTRTMEIKLDGLTIDVQQQNAEIIRRAIDSRDQEIANLKSAQSALQAKLDGANEQIGQLKTEVASAPSKVRAELEGRVKLEAVAGKFGVKLDGLTTDRQVKEAVILKLRPKADLTGKDDAYVNMRFDSAVEDAESGLIATPSPVVGQLQAAAFGGGKAPAGQQRQDEGDVDPEKIRAEQIKKSQERSNAKKA